MSVPPAVRDAAERLLVNLVADERFAAHVAKSEIERLVAAGELVPLARLQMAGGLELTPIGRLAAVEGALRSALALCDADLPNRLDAVRAVLQRVLDSAPAAPVAPGVPAVAPPAVTGTPEPSVIIAGDEPQPPPSEPEPERLEDGRPPGMLKPGEQTVCDWCKTPIDAEQANLGFVRFRVPLCKEHYAKHPNRGSRSAA